MVLLSLNGLCAVQNWEVCIPALIPFTNIKNNWVATVYASAVILPLLIFNTGLCIFYLKYNKAKVWILRVPPLLFPKIEVSDTTSGRVFVLSVLLVALVFPLLIQLIITNKFFYGTAHVDGGNNETTAFACGYFDPVTCDSPKEDAKYGHLSFKPFSEITKQKFVYGCEDCGLEYWPYVTPWLLVLLTFVAIFMVVLYLYELVGGKTPFSENISGHIGTEE